MEFVLEFCFAKKKRTFSSCSSKKTKLLISLLVKVAQNKEIYQPTKASGHTKVLWLSMNTSLLLCVVYLNEEVCVFTFNILFVKEIIINK